MGKLSSLWADDDETSYKRKYVLVDLPTEVPLSVTCSVAAPYRWDGPVSDVVATPAGWVGTVTIHPAPVGVALSAALQDQVHIQLTDKRRFAHPDGLAERGIIIVSGTPGDSVSLNPQLLPPREVVEQIDLSAHTRVAAGAFAAASGQATMATRSGLSLAGGSTPWGEVARVNEDQAAIVAAMTRDNPTGSGTVRGIDFTVAEHVVEVIR